MQIQEADSSSKYLGLPSLLGRNKSAVFGYLKDKVNVSIQSWAERKVSRPAKEILIKMVAQTLPSYAMTVFLLPLELIKDIEVSLAKFFWNSSQKSNSKISWIAWDRMTRHKHAGDLGFRNLRDFNLAMLGKQGWRLITNQDSLVARLYKAKYYPDSTFMEAKLGNSPSFIWRSILEAKKVISAGSSWRIGNGKDIKILNQPWLNDMENAYITTVSPAIINQKVCSLFSMGTKEWDIEIIRDIFESRDQQSILNTIIEQDLDKDVLYWKLETTGLYTVRSAYRMLQSQKGTWSISDSTGFWKSLWQIKAPPQVLNIIWRAANFSLPTMSQLQTKHVQWLQQVFTGQSSNIKAKIITLCWSIWRSRNDLVWNNRKWPVLRIVVKAWEYLSQWNATQSRGLCVPCKPPVEGDGAMIWVKPQQNEVKITVDAAVFEGRGMSGCGIIARDHHGHLPSAKTKLISETLNPTLAEASSVKEALSWAKEMRWDTVVVESDCLVVVQLIRSSVPLRSRLGLIIEDCRELTRHFNSFRIAKEELTESLKKEEILKKQLDREHEVIKAWKPSRDVHAQITKVQGIESFCDEAWKKNKEKLEPILVDGLLTDVSTDDEDYPSDNKMCYSSNDRNPHPSAVSKPISKAKLTKLNEKYGSVSKNFVSGESSQAKKGKKANVGHMTVKQLSDRLEKIEVKTETKRKNNRNGKVGINKHNNYTPDKYAPRKICVKCGSVNHLSVNCKSAMPTPMSVQPQFSNMNAMPPMPVNAMPTQNMNAQFANMSFAPNPYYAAYNMPQMSFSMSYWNNMFAPSMPFPVSHNMHNNFVASSGFKGPTQMTKEESEIPKSNELRPKKQKKKANKAEPKETWVPKST
ncbi:hypothetical protein AgCh_028986 [Apium graveolens]